MPLADTEASGRLQAELTARGIRMTRQRRTILAVMETAKQHLDASQILRRVRKLICWPSTSLTSMNRIWQKLLFNQGKKENGNG